MGRALVHGGRGACSVAGSDHHDRDDDSGEVVEEKGEGVEKEEEQRLLLSKMSRFALRVVLPGSVGALGRGCWASKQIYLRKASFFFVSLTTRLQNAGRESAPYSRDESAILCPKRPSFGSCNDSVSAGANFLYVLLLKADFMFEVSLPRVTRGTAGK